MGSEDKGLLEALDKQKEGSVEGKRNHRSGSSDSESDKPRRRKARKRSTRELASSDSDISKEHRKSRKKHKEKRKRKQRRSVTSSESPSGSEDSSESSSSDSESSDRRKRRKQKSSRDKDRHDKEPRKKRKAKEEKKHKSKRHKKKDKKEEVAKGPLTERWGMYGIIKEIDMWNKRPEFSAWLSEVKKVNLEALDNREERAMFKDYMEDYNTGTLPSKKYYDLMLHHRQQVAKAKAKGLVLNQRERTEFNDEEEKKQELQRERARKQQQEMADMRRSMMGGKAQAMREQEQLREQMQYHYRLGNTQAAEAIKRRLEPDDPAKEQR